MSEQGWHHFLDAEGVNDWVVLHAGATAVFRDGSMREAAGLADAIAQTPGMANAGILLTSGVSYPSRCTLPFHTGRLPLPQLP